MNLSIGVDSFVNVIKLAALIFALLHLGIGLAILRQVLLMNSKVRTSSGGCLRIVVLGHILLLAIILLAIVFI